MRTNVYRASRHKSIDLTKRRYDLLKEASRIKDDDCVEYGFSGYHLFFGSSFKKMVDLVFLIRQKY